MNVFNGLIICGGGAILLVILGHTIQYFAHNFDTNHVANYIYSFHMPLFFMISGFCAGYSKHGLWLSIKKSLVQLLIPFIIWSILLCWLNKLDWKDAIIINPRYWFLIVLFYVRIIHTICQSLSAKIKISEWIVLAFAVICLAAIQFIAGNTMIPCFNVVYYYLLFYVIGYSICRFYSDMEMVLKNKFLLILSGIVFLIWGFFFRRGVVPSIIAFLPGFAYFIPIALIGCYVCFNLSLNYFNTENKLMGFFGIHSLGVYVFSGLICYLICSYIPIVNECAIEHHYLVYVLFLIISAASGGFVYLLSLVQWLRPIIGLQPKIK